MNITLKMLQDEMVGIYIEGVFQAIVHIDAFYTNIELYNTLKKGTEVEACLETNDN